MGAPGGGGVGSGPSRLGRPGGLELPTALVILLALFALGVAVTVAFTIWRLLANLKALQASVTHLGAELTPVLDDLARRSQEAAERAARLQARAPGAGERGRPAG